MLEGVKFRVQFPWYFPLGFTRNTSPCTIFQSQSQLIFGTRVLLPHKRIPEIISGQWGTRDKKRRTVCDLPVLCIFSSNRSSTVNDRTVYLPAVVGIAYVAIHANRVNNRVRWEIFTVRGGAEEAI